MRTGRTIAILALTVALPLGGATLAHAGGEKCARDAKRAEKAKRAKVYAVEGEVQKPLRKAGAAPAYPDIAEKERIEGVVVARLVIEKDGAVSEVEIVEPLRDDFDAHTAEALRDWTFEPATLDGEPVRVHYDVTVSYRLDAAEEEASSTAS